MTAARLTPIPGTAVGDGEAGVEGAPTDAVPLDPAGVVPGGAGTTQPARSRAMTASGVQAVRDRCRLARSCPASHRVSLGIPMGSTVPPDNRTGHEPQVIRPRTLAPRRGRVKSLG